MPPLLLQTLPYQRDSAEWIGRLSLLTGCICLDSGLTAQQEARFDILTALPTAQVRVMAESGTEGGAFIRAQQLLDAYRLPALQDGVLEQLRHLPFSGGLLGYFGYEAAEIAPKPADKTGKSPLDNMPVAVFGIYDWAIIVDHQRCCTELFILPHCPAQTRQHVFQWLAAALTHVVEQDVVALATSFQPLIDRDQYAHAFERLQQWILAGDCYQANLAIPFTAAYKGNAHDVYQRLRKQSQSPFSAYLDAGDFQILSVSPERFLSVNEGRVFTQPIKGTRKRLADPVQDQAVQQDLLNSEKDRAENLMIVDLLRNDLGRVSITGSVKTESLFELHSFTHVHHLISTVSAQLPAETSPLSVMQSCFPGGSITGAPKIRAMQIIAELETVPRTVYCGSIFYCDYLNRMDSSILIRTLLSTQQQLFCWGGSGVVADSVMAQEYQECLDKVSALMNLPLA
jgi:para-aminobenzoate synthetase component 1